MPQSRPSLTGAWMALWAALWAVDARAVAPGTGGGNGAVVAPAAGAGPLETTDEGVAADPAESDAADADAVDTDAEGIAEDVAAGKAELEALMEAETRAMGEEPPALPVIEGLGPTHPLRLRAIDVAERPGQPVAELLPSAEGDAGALVAELAGIDLAALKASYDIPVELHPEVLAYVRFFQGPGRAWFEKWLARSHRWIPLMRPILAEEGVPLDLVYLAMIESGFSAYAYSWAKASGMWQFISATGKRYGLRDDFWVDERRDPVRATRAAARYLKALHREFGDWYLAWAGYNAGEGKIRRAIAMYGTRDFWELTQAGKYLRRETKHYVPKLIAAAIVAKHAARFGFTNVVPEQDVASEEVEVPDATDLAVVAKAAGVSAEAVQSLNPTLRRWCTPPARDGKGYVVRLPAGTREKFLADYAKVAPAERLTFRHHVVRKGDTLGHIALRFGMPVEPIMRLNGIKSVRALRVGQDLIIPLPTQLASKYPDLPSATSGEGPRPKAGAPQARKAVKPAATRAHGPGHYVVRGGDTLWSIAQAHGIALDDLQRWNGLSKRGARTLQVGQSIRVAAPGKSGPAGAKRG